MNTLVFASGNENKVREIRQMLGNYKILSLKDIGFDEEIDENANSTLGNAKIKAETVFAYCQKHNLNYPVFGDDTGLFVKALGGEPGVHSARFGGFDHDTQGLRDYLLKCMEGKSDRTAYFECTIVYKDADGVWSFTGRTDGEITTAETGSLRFGYDPLFYSNDLKKTFGEATPEEKNAVSHRGRAITQLKAWLENRAK